MHGGRETNAPTSAGHVPWVFARIVEAAAWREIRPCAVPPPRIRGGFGQNRAPLRLRILHFFMDGQSLTVYLCRANCS